MIPSPHHRRLIAIDSRCCMKVPRPRNVLALVQLMRTLVIEFLGSIAGLSEGLLDGMGRIMWTAFAEGDLANITALDKR
jgi:hypothetical protein